MKFSISILYFVTLSLTPIVSGACIHTAKVNGQQVTMEGKKICSRWDNEEKTNFLKADVCYPVQLNWGQKISKEYCEMIFSFQEIVTKTGERSLETWACFCQSPYCIPPNGNAQGIAHT